MRNIYWILFSFLIITGCNRADRGRECQRIKVNPDVSIDLPIEKGRIVPLETNDSSLLYVISQIEILDGKYFVFSGSSIFAFDRSGNYLFTVSSRGQSDKEYLNLTSFFVKEGELYLWDSQGYCLLDFDSNGKFLRRISLDKKNTERPIHRLDPYGGDKYIARNSWNGMPGEIPTFTLLDENFHQIAYVKGLTMYDGISLSAPLYYNNGYSFYWELLNDTIYKMQDATIRPEYVVDFGQYSIPREIKTGKTLYELAAYVNKPENINKYATNVRYVCEEDGKLYFVFGMKRANYFVIFNKATSMVKVYGIPDIERDKYRLATFLKVTNEQFIFVLEEQANIENNPSLFIINKKELL